ncbi:conserved exported hypothetical protein [Paraburkholderia ribeironis]|uniref:Uncharacterized protein n=1 Tax=Paraburkholderia ribeironis TaxID=1247936 RepID=A0A1N7RRN7_9BURK|nr:hypothetical protein [Paraburkholderia ribeironis]SIT37736.1 conserved exported hypothetical protein [Paraburkholderia ribeironis]
MKKKMFSAILIISAVLTLIFNLYVGYYYSYIDHDEHEIYFLKKFPTLRREFVNPFANEGDAPPVNELSTNVRRELSDFCKYAYGVPFNDSKSLEGCRAQILREIQ